MIILGTSLLTLKTNTFCTAPSLPKTHPGSVDGPSLGSAGDGDDAGGEDGGGEDGGDGGGGGGSADCLEALPREWDRGPDRHAYSYATLSEAGQWDRSSLRPKQVKQRLRGKKKKAQTAPGGGEAGAAAQSASS